MIIVNLNLLDIILNDILSLSIPAQWKVWNL